MTVFEKVAASPEALGELLDSLTVIDSPWEEAFHRVFCDSCIDSNGTENCDTPGCPHEVERNNPLWWLAQVVEGEQDTSRARWRNGRVEPGHGMIVPLQDEEHHADGTCNAFNVYLNGGGPNGKVLRNIKKVIMPTVSTTESGQLDPMEMRLVFGGCEDAVEIVALMGKKCKLEVRAAVENRNYGGQVEFHGLSYILEAVPLQIDTDTVRLRAGLGLTIGLLVYRYTATVGETQLWDFEWTEQGRKRRK